MNIDQSHLPDISTSMVSSFVNNQDAIIKDALLANGFTIEDVIFSKDNFEWVTSEDDRFKHLFYKGTLRIISIEKNVDVQFTHDNTDFAKNVFTATWQTRYY